MSPPFRLCLRLPLLLRRRRKGAAGYIPPEDASPRRYHNTATNHSATTSLLSRCRRPPQPLPLPQPVCSYHAADDYRNPYLYHNQSAITLRTTTVTPTFTITSLQLSSCGRPPQPVYSYRAVENHHTIGAQQGYRGHTAGAPQTHRRCTADADNNNHRCTADADNN